MMLNYEGDKTSRGQLLLGPAVSVVYRFNSIVGAGLNASFFWHKVNMAYEEKLTNLVTKEVSGNYYNYHHNMQRLNIGINISIGFGRKYDLVGEK